MSDSMISLEFGALKGVDVKIEKGREKSLRAALAKVLILLDKGDRGAMNTLLQHEVSYQGKPCALGALLASAIDRLTDEVFTSTLRQELCETISRATVDDAIRKATHRLGRADPEEGKVFSERFEVEVHSWPTGEILAFEPIGDRWRDVTEDVLEVLDEEEPAAADPDPVAAQLAEDLEARAEGRDLEDKSPEKVSRQGGSGGASRDTAPSESFAMCGLCAQGIPPGAERGSWPSDEEVSSVAVHLECRRQEVARREAVGMYGTATQMRKELAMRGRPVGELWDIGELEQRVLAVRRETDEIDWCSYETRTAQRKQGRPCLICGLAITKQQDYKQASRGRKAHRVCVVKEEDATEREAIQAAEPDIFAPRA